MLFTWEKREKTGVFCRRKSFVNRISESYPQTVNNLWIRLRKPEAVDKNVDMNCNEKLLDFPLLSEYNGNDVFTVLLTRKMIRRRCIRYENDIPA